MLVRSGWLFSCHPQKSALSLRIREVLGCIVNNSLQRNRAETYRLMGRYGDAITDFTRALEIQPDYPWAIQQRALLYRAARRYEEAFSDLTRFIEITPGDPWAIGYRGETYRMMGRYDEALDDFAYALKLDPSRSNIRSKYNELRSLISRH